MKKYIEQKGKKIFELTNSKSSPGFCGPQPIYSKGGTKISR